MERRLLSASKVGLILAVAALVALQSAVTVNAIVCDPHCAVKSGCLRKGPGRCDRLCVPIDIYRLNSDYRCVPRCGGNCLYCKSYMNCGNCRVGYVPVPNGNTAMCAPAGAAIASTPTPAPAVSTVAGTIGTGSTVAVTVGTGSTVAVTAGTGTTVPVTLGTGSTVAVTAGTGTVTVPPTLPTTASIAVTTVTTVPPTTTALVCHPNCTSVCTQHGSGYCDISCAMDYYLTATYVCGACDPYCAAPAPSCNSSGTCFGPCDPGYTVFTSTEMCTACSASCSSCTTPGTCSSSASCNASTSVYDTATSSCLACDPNCIIGCQTPSFCDPATTATPPCTPGYGLTVTKKCGTCDPYCSSGCSVKGAGYCDSACSAGYILDTTTYTCAECQTPSATNCFNCTTAGYCDNCAGTYTFSMPGICG